MYNAESLDPVKKETHSDHNGQPTLSEDQRIRALVRFVARRAAENDYNELLDALKSNPEYGLDSTQGDTT